MNEADTCREYVIPNLHAAGWLPEQILPQYYFTDGRVQVIGGTARRLPRKFADYLLKYRRDTMLAVVEAKAEYKQPGDGLQQAKEYAEILGLPFAYATNGKGIVEFDYATGLVSYPAAFPSPEQLWQRYRFCKKQLAEWARGGNEQGPNSFSTFAYPCCPWKSNGTLLAS